jgi:hypothetical protein
MAGKCRIFHRLGEVINDSGAYEIRYYRLIEKPVKLVFDNKNMNTVKPH